MPESYDKNYVETFRKVMDLDDVTEDDVSLNKTKRRAELKHIFRRLEEKCKESHSEWELAIAMGALSEEIKESNIQNFLRKDDINIFEAMNDIMFIIDVINNIMNYLDEELCEEELEQKKNVLKRALPFLEEISAIYKKTSVRLDKDKLKNVILVRNILDDKIDQLSHHLVKYQ